MKKLFAFLTIILILAACNPPKSKPFTKELIYPDTTITTVTYAFNPDVNDYRTVTARRIVYQREKEITKDSSANGRTTQKVLGLDTIRYASMFVWIDTAKRVQYLDSLPGRRKGVVWLPLTDTTQVIDYYKDWNPSTHHFK